MILFAATGRGCRSQGGGREGAVAGRWQGWWGDTAKPGSGRARVPTWELAGAWRTLLGATGAAKDQAGRQLWLLPTRPWQNGWKPPSFGPFSRCGARSRFAIVGLSHEGTDPCSSPGGSRAGSGSPRRPDKLIPANRECICSCGACRKWDKRNGLHLLSFASPSAPDQTQP